MGEAQHAHIAAHSHMHNILSMLDAATARTTEWSEVHRWDNNYFYSLNTSSLMPVPV